MTKLSNRLKKGDILSETQYYTVDRINGANVILTTDNGSDITVGRGYADNHLKSADHYDSINKVSRTELVNIIMGNARKAMTIHYNKKLKKEDMDARIINLYPNQGGKLVSKAQFQANVQALLDLKGEERIIRGRHYGSQDANGRLHFVDMDQKKDPNKDYDTRRRLVDPRTVNWAIIDLVRYEVK